MRLVYEKKFKNSFFILIFQKYFFLFEISKLFFSQNISIFLKKSLNYRGPKIKRLYGNGKSG